MIKPVPFIYSSAIGHQSETPKKNCNIAPLLTNAKNSSLACNFFSENYKKFREEKRSISGMASVEERQGKFDANPSDGIPKIDDPYSLIMEELRNTFSYDKGTFFSIKDTFATAYKYEGITVIDATQVGTVYHSNLAKHKHDTSVQNIIGAFRKSMDQDYFSESSVHISPFTPWVNFPCEYKITIPTHRINLPVLENIYATAKKVFDETSGPEKFVLASMVDELQKHFRQYPPNGLKIKDICGVTSKYTDFLAIGEYAKKIALEMIKEEGSKKAPQD